MVLRSLGTAFVASVVSVSGQGCDQKGARYVRPSAGFKCADKQAGSKCQCNHCMGEADDPKSACKK